MGYFSLPVLKSKDHTGCSGNMTEVYKNAKSYYDLILEILLRCHDFTKGEKIERHVLHNKYLKKKKLYHFI